MSKQQGKDYFEDDALGRVYLADCIINSLAERSFDYYKSQEKHLSFAPRDLADVKKWSWDAVRKWNGRFDPRKRKIISPERGFDIVLPYDWAHYKVETPHGIDEGQLRLKGTIDLITEVAPGIIEIIDWKTGQRLDWGTGAVKDYKKLANDPQLRIYHYAASKLYPQYKQVMLTINFVRDGGPFSIVFHKQDLEVTERLLRNRFRDIQNTSRPRLNKGWKCKAFCHFGKNNFRLPDGTDTGKTICEYTKDRFIQIGPTAATKELTVAGHSLSYYEAPG